MMHEVVLDDDDPVYINVKKMPTFAELLQKNVSTIIKKFYTTWLLNKGQVTKWFICFGDWDKVDSYVFNKFITLVY